MIPWLPAGVAITASAWLVLVARCILFALVVGLLLRVFRASHRTRRRVWLLVLAGVAFAPIGWSLTFSLPREVVRFVPPSIAVGITHGPYHPERNWVALCCLLGIAFGLMRLFARWRAGLQFVRRASDAEAGILSEARAIARYHGVNNLRVASTSAVGAASLRLRESALLLHPIVADFPGPHRRAILLHEIGHLRERDTAWLLLADLLATCAWYNPVAWLVKARVDLETECAADAFVLSQQIDRHEYADLLLRLARSQQFASRAPGLALATANPLGRRLMAILATNERPRNMRWMVVLAAMSAAFTLFTSVSFPTFVLWPVREGTLIVEGRARLLARDLYPTYPRPSEHGTVHLQSAFAIRNVSLR